MAMPESRRARPWIIFAFGAAVVLALIACFFAFTGRTAPHANVARSMAPSRAANAALPPVNEPAVPNNPRTPPLSSAQG